MNTPECDSIRPITAEYGLMHGELNVVAGTLTLHPQKPRTNADRIRAMSDEELAEFLRKAGGCGPSFDKEYCGNISGCPSGTICWLDWLKQEVSNE